MAKKIACIVMAGLLGATPALAQNAVCIEPTLPPVLDGSTATREQVIAAIAGAKDFVAKSDVYQQCVADDLEAKKAAATKAGTPFDEQLHTVAMAKVAANQEAKDKLAADTNAQANIYKNRVSTAGR